MAEIETTTPKAWPNGCPELALRALYQIEALLPIAIEKTNSGADEDTMLALLGRIQDMNDVAMGMLGETDDESVQQASRQINGREYESATLKGTSHG